MLPPEAANAQPLAPAKSPVAPPAPEAKPEPKPAEKTVVSDLLSSVGKGEAGAQKQVDALEAEKMKLNPPTISLPPKPEPKHTSPVEQWGSYAMMFAALGGMLSRNHMTTALNAASAVMNGFKENDTKKSEQAFKEWESANKTAIQLYDFQNRAYEQALGRIDKSEDLAFKRGSEEDKAASSKINALLHAFGDVAGIEAYQRGGLAGFEEHQKKVADATEQLKEKSADLGLQGTEKLAARKMVESAAWKAAEAAGDKDKQQEMALKLHHDIHDKPHPAVALDKSKDPAEDPLVKAYEKKFLEFDLDANKMTAAQFKANPKLAAARDLALADPDFHPSDFAAGQTFKTTMLSKPEGRTIRTLVSVREHLDYLDALSERLPNTHGSQAMNEVAAALSKQFGHEGVSSFDAAKSIVGPEIIKAITAVGGGGVEERRDAVLKLFNDANTPEQMQGAIRAVKTLLGAQAVSIADEQFRGIKQSIKDRFINPEAIDKYRKDLADEKKRLADLKKSEHGGAAKAGQAGAQPVKVNSLQDLANVQVGQEYIEGGYVSKMTAEKLAKIKARMGGGQ